MPHQHTCGPRVTAVIFATLCLQLGGGSAARGAGVPPILERMSGFACRIDYMGHRSDVPSAPEVSGTARIGPDGFSLDEHAPNYTLHADAGGVVVRAGATTAQTTDPFDADVLINPWAVALAALSHGGLRQRNAGSWQTPNGVLVYFDPNGAVAGLSNARDNGLALTFSGWSDIAGVPVPTRIVRLRQGTQVATFQIDRLTLVRDAGRSASRAAAAVASLSVQPAQRTSASESAGRRGSGGGAGLSDCVSSSRCSGCSRLPWRSSHGSVAMRSHCGCAPASLTIRAAGDRSPSRRTSLPTASCCSRAIDIASDRSSSRAPSKCSTPRSSSASARPGSPRSSCCRAACRASPRGVRLAVALPARD